MVVVKINYGESKFFFKKSHSLIDLRDRVPLFESLSTKIPILGFFLISEGMKIEKGNTNIWDFSFQKVYFSK